MTLKQLSDRTGHSVPFLSMAERGKSGMKIKTLKKILDVLGYEMKIVRKGEKQN